MFDVMQLYVIDNAALPLQWNKSVVMLDAMVVLFWSLLLSEFIQRLKARFSSIVMI